MLHDRLSSWQNRLEWFCVNDPEEQPVDETTIGWRAGDEERLGYFHE
jgi:hypothetical protein